MIIKPISSSYTVSATPTTVEDAKLVRIMALTQALVIISNKGTFDMPANTVEIVEKDPEDTISTLDETQTIFCTAISYKG